MTPKHLPREISVRGAFRDLTQEINSRGEPREIAPKGVHKVVTEKMISQG